MRYARRRFLGQVAAVPFVAEGMLSADLRALGQCPPLRIGALPKPDAAQFAREVEVLIGELPESLRFRRVPVPPERNAWPMWKAAGKAYVESTLGYEYDEAEERYRRGDPDVPDTVKQQFADWVARNRECRRLLKLGMERGALEMPRSQAAARLSLRMDEIMILRNLARVEDAHSFLCLNRNDIDGAIASANTVMRMGMIQMQAECLLVDFIVAVAIFLMGVRAMSLAGSHAVATEAQSKKALGFLNEWKWDNRAFQDSVRVEVCRWTIPNLAGYRDDMTPTELAEQYMLSDYEEDWKPSEGQENELSRAIRRMALLMEGHPHPFDRLETVRMIGKLWSDQLEALDPLQSRSGERTALRQLRQELAMWPSGLEPSILVMAGLPDDDPLPKLSDKGLLRARDAIRKVDNVFGKHLAYECLASIQPDFLIGSAPARSEAARLKIAFACFEKKHGRLPKELEELTTDGLLGTIPNDPFDDKPFGYAPSDRLFWSAGTSGIDKTKPPALGDEDDEDFELVWRIHVKPH